MLEKELIFLDTEFTSLNPYIGEILSIGMVKENGEEFSIELECEAEPCASGGCRDDVEALRWSVLFLRSDTAFDPVAMQCQTYGLAV